MVHTHLCQCEVLQLFGQLEGMCGCLPRTVLGLWRSCETQEQVTAEQMMVFFIPLNRLPVHLCGVVIALGLAQLNKLLIFHHRDRLAGELSSSDTFNGVFEGREIVEEGTETLC